jgi:hypothetical protein
MPRSLAWLHLGWLVVGCTVWNKVEVCDQKSAPPLTVNHGVEGTQKTGSPAAMVPLPNGNAVVVFVSQIAGRSPEDAMEIRSVRLTSAGARLPSCDHNDQLDDVLVAVDPANPAKQVHDSAWLAPPLAAGRVGLITYRVDEADHPSELWGMWLQSDGCPFLSSSDRRQPFLIAQAMPGEILAGNSAVALGSGPDDDFLVLWEELSPVDGFHAKARVARMTPIGPQFLPTTLARDGGVAELPDISDTLYSLAPVVIGKGQVAVAVHFSTDLKDSNVTVRFFDDRLAPISPPAAVAEGQTRGDVIGGRSVTAAFDGRTLLVGWLAEDPGGRVTLFTRALDAAGGPRGPARRLSIGGGGGSDGFPAAAAWKDHGFVVAWRQQDGQPDAPGASILGRLLDGNGQPAFTGMGCGEAPFVIAHQADGDRRQPSLAALRSTDVLAVWTDDGKSGADRSEASVRGRLLSANGLFVGDEYPGGAPGRAPADAGAVVAPHGPDGGGPASCGAPGSALAGQPCTCNTDCESGVKCVTEPSTGIPGGTCAKACVQGTPDSCGGGSMCRGPTGTPDGYCYKACTATAECGPYRVCQDGRCLAYCGSDADCRSGHCDPYRNFCSADAQPLSGVGLYQPCLRNDDCRSRQCLPANGRCISTCSPEKPNCPEGAVCVPFPDGGGGTCLFPCVDGKCTDPKTSCYTDPRSGKKGCL